MVVLPFGKVLSNDFLASLIRGQYAHGGGPVRPLTNRGTFRGVDVEGGEERFREKGEEYPFPSTTTNPLASRPDDRSDGANDDARTQPRQTLLDENTAHPLYPSWLRSRSREAV